MNPYLYASFASSVTAYPFDLIKNHRQLNQHRTPKTWAIHTRALLSSMTRNSVFVTTKLWTYDQLERLSPSTSFANKVLYGVVAGVTGATVGTPFDLVMVRMQTMSNPTTLTNMCKEIYQKDGVFGFWNGCEHMMKRAAIVTACQLPVYHQTAQILEPYQMTPHGLVLVSATTAAMVTAIVSNPSDVCKTRQMRNQSPNTIWSVAKQEGLRGLSAGLPFSIMRQVPVNITRLMVLELCKKIDK